MDGSLDELTIYDRALSATEVEELYNLSRPLYSLHSDVINRDSNITLQIEPNDGDQFGIALNSTQLTVLNFIPEVHNVTIHPTALNNTIEEIAGTWDFLDYEDEENATVYEWYINGTNAWSQDLVGYWKLDGNYEDSSENKHHGNSSSHPSNSTGKIKGAMNFSSDVITIPNETNFDYDRTDSFTACFWTNVNSFSSVNTFISKLNPGAPFEGWEIHTYDESGGSVNDGISLYLIESWSDKCVWGRVNDILAGTENTWQHICTTYNGNSDISGVAIYKNGLSLSVEANTCLGNPTASILNNYPVMIGQRGGGSAPLDGEIDEVMIWNRTLSATEISDLYNMTFYGQIGHEGDNHTINNITSSYYNQTGTTLTFGVTPYDGIEYGDQRNSTTITLSDVTMPTISNQINYTTNRINYTMSAQSSESGTCTLYGNWTGTWDKNETIEVTENIAFNFTILYLLHNSLDNLLWNVNCSDESANMVWGTNITFTTVNTTPYMDLLNITELDGTLIDRIETDENATLYINITSTIPIDTVWIIIWETIIEVDSIF